LDDPYGFRCSICDRPADAVVSFTMRGVTYEKDLCDRHLLELLDGARRVRPAAVR
jgi:hypothetical protein